MKFIKENFSKSGDFLHYEGKFVGRFKYATKSSEFKAFLIKNFTVEEYFGRLEAGEAPALILESKGFIPKHIRDRMMLSGFMPTVDNIPAFASYVSSQFKNAMGAV